MKRLIIIRPGATDGQSFTDELNQIGAQQAEALVEKLKETVGDNPVKIWSSTAPCAGQMAALAWGIFSTNNLEQDIIVDEAFMPSGKKMSDLVPEIIALLENEDANEVTNIVFGHHDYLPELLVHYFKDIPLHTPMPDKAEGWCFDFTDPENPKWSLISARR